MAVFHAHFGTVKEAVDCLKNAAPTKYPTYIIRRKLNTESGYCFLRDKTRTRPKRFEIAICKTLQENAAVLILVHEWAHALAWFKEGSNHGPQWGVAYARCWRLLTEENEDWS